MLNYRNTLIGFLAAMAALVITGFFVPVNAWFYLLPALAFMTLLIWGSVSIQAGFYMKSFCHGEGKGNVIALTFDDGPDERLTPVILDILKEHNCKAAFFVVGCKAEKYPEILRRIHTEGHIIGGHSYSHHFFFDLFTFRKMKQELMQTSAIVHRATGKKIKLFRPPYGVTNPVLARAVKALHYVPVGWSLKSKDAVIKDGKLLLSNLKMNLKAGDIVLFHDNRPLVVDLLATFCGHLKDERFRTERIDNFLNVKAYED